MRAICSHACEGGELGEFNMYKSGGWRNVFYKRVLQEAISHPSSAEGKLLKRFWEPFKKEKMEFHLGENVTLYCSGFWFSTKNDKQNNVTLLTYNFVCLSSMYFIYFQFNLRNVSAVD